MLSSSALLGTWVAAGIAIFFVVNLVYALWTGRRQVSSSAAWPTTQGEILTSRVTVPATHSSDDEADCAVEISYRYAVGGKEHRGSHIHAGREAMMVRRAAESLAAKYPAGAKVEVHYRPDKPGTALLEPKDSGNTTALIVFLVVFSPIALVLVAHGIAGKVLLLREGGVPVFALLLPLACLAIAAGAVYEYVRMRRLRHESAAWPSVAGRITTSCVVEEQSTSTDDRGRETTSTSYRPDIEFAYEAGGREFHSSQWSWGWTALYSDTEGAQKVAAKYKEGASVPVYYDPKDPSNAVLEPANRQGTAVPLVVAFVFAAGGALMLWAFPLLHSP
jgi:hypothetical protein